MDMSLRRLEIEISLKFFLFYTILETSQRRMLNAEYIYK